MAWRPCVARHCRFILYTLSSSCTWMGGYRVMLLLVVVDRTDARALSFVFCGSRCADAGRRCDSSNAVRPYALKWTTHNVICIPGRSSPSLKSLSLLLRFLCCLLNCPNTLLAATHATSTPLCHFTPQLPRHELAHPRLHPYNRCWRLRSVHSVRPRRRSSIQEHEDHARRPTSLPGPGRRQCILSFHYTTSQASIDSVITDRHLPYNPRGLFRHCLRRPRRRSPRPLARGMGRRRAVHRDRSSAHLRRR